MKFLCGGCNRLMDVERFRLEGAALVVTCTSCNAENRAEALSSAPAPAPSGPVAVTRPAIPGPEKPAKVTPPPANVTALRTPTVEAIARARLSAAEPDPFAVPEGHCPKCVAKMSPQAVACPSCGLVFAQASTTAFNPSEWLKAEWLALLAAWGDDSRHEKLRAAAMEKAELAELGRLYRLRLADQPQDPYALRGRDEVLRLAVLPQVSLQKMKVETGKVPKWKYVALSAVIVGCLIALFILVRQMLTLS